MFKITKIELENFKSFQGKHIFKFPKEPGLYYLSGENKTEPRLGPNACGKTSLIDGIFWCLYGRTTRGLKAGDIRNWHLQGAGRCGVRTWLSVADNQLVITRTQSPNSLTIKIDGGRAETITQEQLNELIRLGPETFLHSIIAPQFGEMFFDLKPAAKLTLFSEIMDLDYWLTKSDEAKRIASKIENELRLSELRLSNLKGKLESFETSLSQTERLADEFEEEKQYKINKLREDIKIAKNRNREDELNLEKVKEERDSYAQVDTDVRNDINQISKEIKTLNEKKFHWEAETKELFGKAQAHKANLERLRGIKGKCPICRQPVTSIHVDEEAIRIKQIIKDIEIEAETITKETKNYDLEIKEQQKILSKLNKEYEAVSKKYKITQDKLTLLKAKQTGSNDIVRRLGMTLADEKRRKNPHIKTLKRYDREINETEDEIESVESFIIEETEHYEEVNYWVNGFKRIRLYVVEETLKQLEVEVNNDLVSLGLLDWRIEFDVERENKSGGVTTGFSVFIYSPDNEQPVKWEAWSGGETQRLRLAGTLGLSHLIADRIGLQFKIEYFDELSTHMSEEGIEDMLDTLHQRALDTDSSIWLIDHSVLNFGGFSGKLTVIKDEDGSHLNYEDMSEGE